MRNSLQIKTLLLSSLMWSCGVPENTSETSSLVLTSARWPNPNAIPVCWANGAQVSAEIKDDIKAKIILEYHNKTALRFTRFDDCTATDFTSTLIRVHFNLVHNWDDSSSMGAGGGLSFLGPVRNSLGGTAGQGTMRIDIGTRGTYPPLTNGLRQFAIDHTRGTAVHEFGHAIGLAHEQSRTDAPNCNDQSRTAEEGDWVYVGAYDATSIMNYCKTGNLNSLSSGDVGGVNFLYPPTTATPSPAPTPAPAPAPAPAPTPTPTPGLPQGAFYLSVKHSAKCVDIDNASREEGAKAQQFGCNQTVAQMFRIVSAAKGSFSLQNVNSGKCLDLAVANRNDGTTIVQRTCSGAKSQRMTFRPTIEGYQLIQLSSSGKCLEVNGSSTLDRAAIVQRSCAADAPHQNFLKLLK